MGFENTIEDLIIAEAHKHASRFQEYHNYLEILYQRKRKRINTDLQKIIHEPTYWSVDPKYNPFYVIHHRRQIAKAIATKLCQGTYKPNPPHIVSMPKDRGGTRSISVYQIPDAAISRWLYERLLRKNRHRFSSFSYAYRNDRNVQFAIQDIAADLRYYTRTFVSEFDFSDFFGSISHDYLFSQFDENGFYVTKEEKSLIKSFLQSNDKGVPQGTSISLFLANIVCWRLDKALELNGLKFARYADDTLVWSSDYGKICKSFEIIDEFSREAGVSINFKKSEGISLLSRRELPSEFARSKHYVEFLGYKLSVDTVAIKNSSVSKIKKQISYLLYKNLIQPLKGTKLKALIIPSAGEDPAFLTAIMEIRRYLYGNLSEEQLIAYLKGTNFRISFKGIMSFYPLVEDEKQLKELDGWLVATIYRSLRLRRKLLKKWKYDRSHQFPFNVPQPSLVSECRKQFIDGKRLLEIPSFLRIYKVIRKGLLTSGIEEVMNPNTNLYNYSAD